MALARLDVLRRGLVSPDSETGASINFLKKDGFLSLPDDVLEQYDAMQSRSFMGVFPEINRVWITIDNRFYLWNYLDHTSPDAFTSYDDQEQIIISAALVKPLSGVLLQQLEYILVLATPLEIILLGIGFAEKAAGVGAARGTLRIYRTDLSIASDGVNMTSIVGTDKGRIFMRGNNGQLYEIEYAEQDGWFTRKMRKINHSSNGISLFLPTFLVWGSEDSIRFVVVNNGLNLLFTVSTNNHISMVSLGSDGKNFKQVARITDIFSQVLRFSNFIPQAAIDERTFEIVSLHPISTEESLKIHLVAITSTGVRLYFSTVYRHDSVGVSSSNFQLVFARGPPVFSQAATQYNAISNGKIHESFYRNGLLVASQAFTDEIDRIVSVSLNSGLISQSSPVYLAESTSFVDIEGKTWAVAELESSKQAARHLKTSAGVMGYMLNDLATQFEFPARKFLVLTNMGITTITKLRPIDLLMQLLSQFQGQDVRFFEDFFTIFGRDQSCAMCLGIACGHSSIMSSPTNLIPNNLVAMATKLFFELSGKPAINSGQPLQSTGAAGPLGIPVSTFEIKHSSKHNGLALYLARILRHIWNVELIKKTNTGSSAEKWDATQSIETLISVQMNLQSLDRFLKQYPQFTQRPTPDLRPNGIDPELWKVEQESLANMHELIGQTIETISFVSLLIDYKLPQSMPSMLTDVQKREFQNFTFEALVSTPKGRDIGKLLMTTLINQQIKKEVDVEVITATLQQRCPSICQANDVVYYKGMELVQNAKQVMSLKEQQAILSESLRLFLTIMKHIHFDKIIAIAEHYKSLRFFTGVVDLVLAFAAEQRLTDPVSSEAINSQHYFRLLECYQVIFDLFASINALFVTNGSKRNGSSKEDVEAYRAEVLNRALASNDHIFHTCLYEWFIQHTLFDYLLQIQSPFLVEYLIEHKNNLTHADLLWQYYVRNGRFLESANVLSEIARLPGLDLMKRMEYLTKAVTNAKSSTGIEFGGNQELLNDLTDELDVARVQLEIYKRLESMPGYDAELSELNQNLLDVSQLFHRFARPFQMHEVTLHILHISDHGVQGRALIESAWLAVIRQTKEEALLTNRSPYEALGDKIREVGRRFYPDDNVFPLHFLINKLEQDSFEDLDKSVAPKRGWVVDAFRAVNIPFITIFQSYHHLFDTKPSPWTSNKALVFLIQDIQALLTKWLEFVRSQSSASVEREEFPARFVDEAISKYLVSVHEDEVQLISALNRIQSRVRSVF